MNQIRNHRLNRNMTQKELAEKAGMSLSYLKDFEAGRRTNISAKLLDQWRRALGISACSAFGVLNPTQSIEKCS